MKKITAFIIAAATLLLAGCSSPEAEKVLEGITLDTASVQKEFAVGDAFNHDGLKVTANYSDKTSAEVTRYDVTGPDMSVAGEGKTVTVSYTEGKLTKTATYSVDVKAVPVVMESISLDTKDVQKEFTVGDEFNCENIIVTVHYDDGSTIDVSIEDCDVTPPDMTTVGEGKTVTVSYTEDDVTKSDTYTVDVKAAPIVLTGIKVNTKDVQKDFAVGEAFNCNGLVVTASYEGKEDTVISVEDCKVEAPDMTTQGIGKEVKVSYTEGEVTKSDSYKINVEGPHVKVVFENSGLSDTQEISTVQIGEYFTLSKSAASSGTAPKYYASDKTIRFYNNNIFEISGTKKISQVVFTVSGGSYIQALNGTYTASETTWTGEGYFIQFKTTGTAKISEIKIYYDPDSSAPQEFKTDVETVSVESSAISAKVTLTTGASIPWTASCANATVTPDSGTGTNEITVSFPANTGVAAVEYELVITTSSAEAIPNKASVKITQAGKLASTIAEIVAVATTSDQSFSANLTGAIVTYVSGKNAFIEDETSGVLLYESAAPITDLVAGDKISGPVSGTIVLYQGYAEIKGLTRTSATITHDQKVPETEVTIEALQTTPSAYYNKRVIIKGVDVTKGINSSDKDGTVAQGGKTLAIRGNNGAEIGVGLKGSLVGYLQAYGGNLQFAVYDSKWFIEDTLAPNLLVSTSSIDVAAAATSAEFTVDSNVEWTASASTGATASKEGNKVTVTFPANTADDGKTYTVTVAPVDGALSALAKTVTINQAGTKLEDISFGWSRPASADVVTEGFAFSKSNVSGKSGYYQDGGTIDVSVNTLTLASSKQSAALFVSTPKSITVKAKIGGGSGDHDLNYPVEVCLLDASGSVIASTVTTITKKITTKEGDNYNITLPNVEAAYGVQVSHKKEDGFNVRYISIDVEIKFN